MVTVGQLSSAFGIIGNVTSVTLYLSPLFVFHGMWKKKSVEEYSVLPYMMMFLSCMLWMFYALPIVKPHKTPVLTINAAGAAIELGYIFVYFLCSTGTTRVRVVLLLLLESIFVAVVAAVVLCIHAARERRAALIGIICIVARMLAYIAPLSILRSVIRTKSVEYMPLHLSIVYFFNGLCWTLYSSIDFDANILIPNGVGVVFSVAQLGLHAMYYKSTKAQLVEKKIKGDKSLLVDVSTSINVVIPINIV